MISLSNKSDNIKYQNKDEFFNDQTKNSIKINEGTSGICGPNANFTTQDNILTIFGSGPITNYSDITGHHPWWDYRSNFITLKINDGITSIGSYAFYSFMNLESVTMTSSVTVIFSGAFKNCQKLKSINISDNMFTLEVVLLIIVKICPQSISHQVSQ